MHQLHQIIVDRPQFHRGETEIKRDFSVGESYLNSQDAQKLASRTPTCWGIGSDLAQFLYDSVNPESKTLETGAGISTLIFALQGADHIAITPNETEAVAIRGYAATKGINIHSVNFIIDESDKYLPKCSVDGLDVVLIDGKHAFPLPIIDWFYTAERLKEKGLMIIDDANLYSVTILRDFMNEDPRWKLRRAFSDRTFVFEKLHKSVHDVAWHMQPYLVKRLPPASMPHRNLFKKLRRYLSSEGQQ